MKEIKDIIKKLLDSDGVILLDPKGLYYMCHVDLNHSDSKLVEVQEVTPGTTIRFVDIPMEVLNIEYPSANGETGVFCLSKDILFNRDFGKRNNWKESSLRKYLNGEFYEDLIKKTSEDCILPFRRNLVAEDGLKDYETCVDNISLISCNEYRGYHEYIQNKGNWWWTLTAHSTGVSNSASTRVVFTDGTLYSGNVSHKNYGVVPVFLLLPSTPVEIVKDKNKTSMEEV